MIIQIQVVVANTHGFEEFSVAQTSRLYQEMNVSAIIGPNFYCQAEAMIAGILNRAMMSYVSGLAVNVILC